jgi:hypothetical protein
VLFDVFNSRLSMQMHQISLDSSEECDRRWYSFVNMFVSFVFQIMDSRFSYLFYSFYIVFVFGLGGIVIVVFIMGVCG